jgi:transcriptional regulator with XRE-family HTH domain
VQKLSIYENVKKIAEEEGLSLQKVADKANLSINSLYGWKINDPSISKVEKVANVLHVSVDKLLGKPVKSTDLSDDVQFTFQGRPISEDEMKIVRRLLNSDNDD